MKTREILNQKDHRPWALPTGKWKYYQEWNEAIFLHWRVEEAILRKMVPDELEIDRFEGEAWVSAVAFSMKNVRPRKLPAFPPLSDFDEINIRTYVRCNHKPGVYFLSIEAGSKAACSIAKTLSGLPYQHAEINRKEGQYISLNRAKANEFKVCYTRGSSVPSKMERDCWLTEKYALFQEQGNRINAYDIHHVEWPLTEITIRELHIDYPALQGLIHGKPDTVHYSSGVQVLAWPRTVAGFIP
ncbi:MAG TPA: hypothetical protein DCG19_15505 [Cryomorphaceae bacterium]|nr:hypothetical protein [Owenweeksia sp.]MBF99178.1 hypothetical protein [Owenweeksia sp.]HAD98819.1 hypothetical protein [Cryomorphaceae bacterium]HBF19303.1 hypothetical protein [Cryomorphaceae bacterium]|tara:strand:+ start:2278 stop:3006 length:729 start_codon:yes stop_codon:yes gene_type:complete